MTQEQKELLFKDICCRLPYGVKAYVKNWSKFNRKWIEDVYTIESIHPSLNNIFVCSERGSVEVIVGYDDYEIKPYLFPMSIMTEEQCYKLASIRSGFQDCWKYIKTPIPLEICNFEQIDWFHRNHFDYRGLIEKDLALDATYLNIY